LADSPDVRQRRLATVKILYLHGIHGGPGAKVERLRRMPEATEVRAPTLHDLESLRRLDQNGFSAIVGRAQAAFDDCRPDLIVGSSFGGMVALQLHASSERLLLLSPFWRRSVRALVATLPFIRRVTNVEFGCKFVWTLAAPRPLPAETIILHCPLDRTIPIAHSRELLAVSGLPPGNLVPVAYDGGAVRWRRGFHAHRMSFPNALDQLELWARRLLPVQET
jgi:hypothetical protein